MLKYTTTQIVFSEIPEEVTLAVEISNCPIHCPSCHSKHLWNDVGAELDINVLDRLATDYSGITCICFMGGDGDLESLLKLASYLKDSFPNLNLAWYSGREEVPLDKFVKFDYVKLGPYKEEFGPLNQETTNQRLYKREGNTWIDITYKFWNDCKI